MEDRADAVIVGGGVIGLTTAYYLAAAGSKVVVLDRANLGSEASWAGAGIIPPGNSAAAQSPLDRLRAISSESFPALSNDLKTLVEIDNGYIPCGILDLELPDPELRDIWRKSGIEFEIAEGNEPWPGVQFSGRTACYFPKGAQVRNCRHIKALLAALDHFGVLRIANHEVTAFKMNGGKIELVETSNGRRVLGRNFVLATGAWSRGVAEFLGFELAINPVRGQIVLLKGDRRLFLPIIERGKRYLVPRADGRVLIGSTEEPEAGFEKANTAGAVTDLLNFAIATFPALNSAQFERCWSGLRPGSADGLPTIGPVPGFDNLFVGAGHGRAGIQQSIATGMILRDLVLGRPPMMDISAFRVGRPPAPPAEPLFRS